MSKPKITTNQRHIKVHGGDLTGAGVDLSGAASDPIASFPKIDLGSDRTQITRQDLINALTTLSERRKFQRVTRQNWRDMTNVPDGWWMAHFGTWPAFLEAANLETSTGSRKIANAVARHARSDVYTGISNERKNWGKKFIKPVNQSRWKTIMAASDFHDIEADPFAVRMFVHAIKVAQPDIICLNGDLFDLPEFSKHPNDPREWLLKERIDAALDIVRKIRQAAPDAQIDLIEGNHEARLLKFLVESAPQMMSLLNDVHDMDLRKLLRLDEYEVNYVAQGDLRAFTDAALKREVLQSERMYYNTVLARHHPPTKGNIHTPGFNGHHHSYEVSTHHNPFLGSYLWTQTGGMHKRQASYTEGRKWNCGFLYADIDTKYRRANFDYTVVGDTACRFGGEFFERDPDEYYPGLSADLDNAL